jgi:hypothetical protein
MPLIKAMKIAGMGEMSKATVVLSFALIVYIGIEIYKNFKETKVLAQQKKINDYKLAEYKTKYDS